LQPHPPLFPLSPRPSPASSPPLGGAPASKPGTLASALEPPDPLPLLLLEPPLEPPLELPLELLLELLLEPPELPPELPPEPEPELDPLELPEEPPLELPLELPVPASVGAAHWLEQLVFAQLANAVTSELVLQDAGGLAEVRQLVHVVSFAQACSWLQQDAVRHVSHAATPVVNPQPVVPPLELPLDPPLLLPLELPLELPLTLPPQRRG
jgi:hypothetical protein